MTGASQARAFVAVLLAAAVLAAAGCRAKPDQSRAGRRRSRTKSGANFRCVNLNAAGNRYAMVGRYDSAIACYQEALALANDSGLANRAAASCQDLGIAFEQMGEFDSARRYYELARQYATDTTTAASKDMAAGALLNHAAHLVLVAGYASDSARCFAMLDTARTELEQALQLVKQAAGRPGLATIAHNLGSVLASLGRYDSAYAMYHIALQVATENRDIDGQCLALSMIGKLLFFHGAPDSAAGVMRRAVELSTRVREKAIAGHVLANLGNIYGTLGDFPRARDCFEQAMLIYRRANRPVDMEEVNSALILLDILQSLEPEEEPPPGRQFRWFESS